MTRACTCHHPYLWHVYAPPRANRPAVECCFGRLPSGRFCDCVGYVECQSRLVRLWRRLRGAA